jgi:hypothetical protein
LLLGTQSTLQERETKPQSLSSGVDDAWQIVCGEIDMKTTIMRRFWMVAALLALAPHATHAMPPLPGSMEGSNELTAIDANS